LARLIYITIDCNDAGRMAAFWSAALDGYTVDENGTMLRSQMGPDIYLQEVPEDKQSKKNRLHLDIGANNREEEVIRLERLGARVIEEKEYKGYYWTIMQDPEGNEFCVTPMSQG